MVNGILLLYHHPLQDNAPTIMEHVNALTRHSRFHLWPVNTELGFPRALRATRFRTVVLHYSLFGSYPFPVGGSFLDYLAASSDSYKVAFFQDEYQFCPQRFDFIDRYGVDCIFTLLDPPQVGPVYRKHTRAQVIHHNLTGYVSDDLVALAGRLTKPDSERTTDVGYRGRPLAFFLGEGALEKTRIATGFLERAAGLGLALDIETSESKRIYGNAWYRWLANCRAVLGVEAGATIFDLEDEVRTGCERLLAEDPQMGFEEVSRHLLHRWEGNIPYRTISPRHFEAAAFRVCQILFEGRYSGVMRPMVHYIPLRKDFSNLGEVIRLFRDAGVRRELTENAYQDLVASGRYSYRTFVEGFDEVLMAAGLQPDIPPSEAALVSARLDRGLRLRAFLARCRSVRNTPFPGRKSLARLKRSLMRLAHRGAGARGGG